VDLSLVRPPLGPLGQHAGAWFIMLSGRHVADLIQIPRISLKEMLQELVIVHDHDHLDCGRHSAPHGPIVAAPDDRPCPAAGLP
jgi:hypothetical protein